MQVQVRKLEGSWDLGYALHKHTLSSVYLGDDEHGHPRFDNTRSEPGEALYQLKYRGDWNQIAPLAAQIQATLLPLFGKIGLIIPMPASTTRARQPVDELAAELGRITGIPVFNNVVVKAPAPQGAPQLKTCIAARKKMRLCKVGSASIRASPMTAAGMHCCWMICLIQARLWTLFARHCGRTTR